MIARKEHNISYAPVSCSQATALKDSDRIIAKQQTILEISERISVLDLRTKLI